MGADTKELPPRQVEINNLRDSVATPEDVGAVEEMQAEFDKARRDALMDIGETALPVLVELPDGSVVTEEERRQIVASGNSSGPYDGRGRA